MGFFDDFKSSLKTGVENMFSVEAIYTPAHGTPVPCLVKLDHDVLLQPSGYDAQVIETGSTITAFVSDVGEPESGGIFLIEGVTYEVARITDNDRFCVTMAVIDD